MLRAIFNAINRRKRLRVAREARRDALDALNAARRRHDTRAQAAASLRLQRCTADVLELEGGW
jgi:hypothetical protein